MQRWSLRPNLGLDSDKSRCFNHRDELDSTVQLPNFRSVMARYTTHMRAIYSTRLAFYPRHYVSQEKVPAVLVKEGNMQLVKYSLDIRVRYSTYSPIFKSQKGSTEAMNFLMITP